MLEVLNTTSLTAALVGAVPAVAASRILFAVWAFSTIIWITTDKLLAKKGKSTYLSEGEVKRIAKALKDEMTDNHPATQ